MNHVEPVVKKDSSFSVLFLRDDSSVVSFRLRAFWIKALIVSLFLFSGASGATGYAAHYYWKRYHSLKLEHEELKAEYNSDRTLLASYSVATNGTGDAALPRSTMTDITSLIGDTGGTTAPPTGQSAEAEQPDSRPDAVTSAQTTAATPDETSQPSTAHTSQATDSATAQSASANALPAAESSDPAASSGHPALISEVLVKRESTDAFALEFALSNRDPRITLNGRVVVSVGTQDGKTHEITQVNKNALRFIINNYKRVSTRFSLPNGVQTEDVKTLHLKITAEDQPAISYSFAVPASS